MKMNANFTHQLPQGLMWMLKLDYDETFSGCFDVLLAQDTTLFAQT